MQPVSITSLEQTLLQECRHTVRYHAITLHLSETETTVSTTTFHRLTSEDLHWATSTRVDLVVDHVLETLVVRRAEVDLRLELAAGVAVVHDLEATRLVALLAENLRDGLDGEVGEWCRVTLVSDDSSDLGKQTLDQVTDGHTGGDGVGVDDDVGCDTLSGERHILLTVGDTNRTLLTVARRELVSNLGNTSRPYANLDELLAFRVRRDEDLVDDTALGALERG